MRVRQAYVGLRTLVDCGTVTAGRNQPEHLQAAVNAGWASRDVKWVRRTGFINTYSLAIPREEGERLLGSVAKWRWAA